MSAARPNPLTPADLDLSALDYMPLHYERLKRSATWIKAKRNPEIGFYLINLWTSAFAETPAASLPNDDVLLCDAAMCDPKRWPKVRESVLAGFILCSNDRWYHRFVAEVAHEALEKRLKWRGKKRRQRGGSGGDNGPNDGGVPQDVHPRVPGDNRGDDAVDMGGETPLRDGTGRDGTGNIPPAAADARAREPTGPPDGQTPSWLIRDPKHRCLALVAEQIPSVENDLKAWPALTSSQGLITAWLAEGADLERDIVPAIEAECLKLRAKGKKPIGFSWFADAVAANKSRNSDPLPERTHGQRASPQPGKPLSAGQRTLVEVAAILGGDPARPDRPRDRDTDAGPVVDADAVAVEG